MSLAVCESFVVVFAPAAVAAILFIIVTVVVVVVFSCVCVSVQYNIKIFLIHFYDAMKFSNRTTVIKYKITIFFLQLTEFACF